MKIDLNAVRRKFDEVLGGISTRESVSAWAKELREAEDRNELQILPDSDEPRVWEAILFLEGVDLKDAPESYLHNDEDIVRERP